MAGMGKTYLALRFAHEKDLLEHFDGIFHQFCGDNPAGTIVTELAEKAGIDIKEMSPEKAVETLKNKLSQQRCLLILDDVKNNEIEKILPGRLISRLSRRGVLGIVPLSGPNKTFAKPVETFFELAIMSAPSFKGERDVELL